MQPYTYCLTHIPTGRRYYGARWSKDCNPKDLWVTYFTSSKHIKQLIEQDGIDSFRCEIRKVFRDVTSCRDWENRVLQRLKVTTNDNWINKNINGNFLPYGKQAAEHVRKRIEKTTATKKQRTYIVSEETRKKISMGAKKALTGVPKSKAHVEAMKNRPQDTNITTCEHCNKTGDYKNMKRWHHDRCHSNPNRKSDIDPKEVTCIRCGHTALQSANFFQYHDKNCIYVHSDS